MSDLKADIEEMRGFVEKAIRPKIKGILTIQLRKLEAELSASSAEQCPPTKGPVGDESRSVRRGYTVQIATYAYDQSDKFFKIFVSHNMTGIQSLSLDKIETKFTENSLHFTVRDFNDKNYELVMKNLYDDIVPDQSSFRIKQDMVLLMLKKKNIGKTWPYVTKVEEKEKEKLAPKVDKDKDPNEALMDMLKNMYQDGDDDMKRTIAKAWSESEGKRASDANI